MAGSGGRLLAVVVIVLGVSTVPGLASASATGQTPQTLQFTSSPPTDAVVGFRYGYGVTATSSSGLPVVLTADPATPACSAGSETPMIYGNVSAIHAGTCTIFADQPGDATYAAAPRISMTFQIAQETTVVATKSASKGILGLTPTTFKATLTAGGWFGPAHGQLPFGGEPITFRVGGKVMCTGTTVYVNDGTLFGSAVATCKATLGPQAAWKNNTYTATYAGSQDYSGSSATGKLVP